MTASVHTPDPVQIASCVAGQKLEQQQVADNASTADRIQSVHRLAVESGSDVLVGSDEQTQTLIREWLDFFAELDRPLSDLLRPNRGLFDKVPVSANVRAAAVQAHCQTSPTAVLAAAKIFVAIEALDNHLSSTKLGFIAGSKFTLADICGVCSLIDAYRLAIPISHRNKHKAVLTWLEACLALPAFEKLGGAEGVEFCEWAPDEEVSFQKRVERALQEHHSGALWLKVPGKKHGALREVPKSSRTSAPKRPPPPARPPPSVVQDVDSKAQDVDTQKPKTSNGQTVTFAAEVAEPASPPRTSKTDSEVNASNAVIEPNGTHSDLPSVPALPSVLPRPETEPNGTKQGVSISSASPQVAQPDPWANFDPWANAASRTKQNGVSQQMSQSAERLATPVPENLDPWASAASRTGLAGISQGASHRVEERETRLSENFDPWANAASRSAKENSSSLPENFDPWAQSSLGASRVGMPQQTSRGTVEKASSRPESFDPWSNMASRAGTAGFSQQARQGREATSSLLPDSSWIARVARWMSLDVEIWGMCCGSILAQHGVPYVPSMDLDRIMPPQRKREDPWQNFDPWAKETTQRRQEIATDPRQTSDPMSKDDPWQNFDPWAAARPTAKKLARPQDSNPLPPWAPNRTTSEAAPRQADDRLPNGPHQARPSQETDEPEDQPAWFGDNMAALWFDHPLPPITEVLHGATSDEFANWWDVEVLHESKTFVGLSKPAFMSTAMTHSKSIWEKSSTNFVHIAYQRLENMQCKEDGRWYRGLCNSLDASTSGVQILGRTPEACSHFATIAATHRVSWDYIALVEGRMGEPGEPYEGIINVALRRTPDFFCRFDTPGSSACLRGRQAITKYRALRQWLVPATGQFRFWGADRWFTLVQVRALTDCAQQVRMHLAFTGHPIVCDGKYNTQRFEDDNSIVQRTFIHCCRAEFEDCDGKPFIAVCELAHDLQAAQWLIEENATTVVDLNNAPTSSLSPRLENSERAALHTEPYLKSYCEPSNSSGAPEKSSCEIITQGGKSALVWQLSVESIATCNRDDATFSGEATGRSGCIINLGGNNLCHSLGSNAQTWGARALRNFNIAGVNREAPEVSRSEARELEDASPEELGEPWGSCGARWAWAMDGSSQNGWIRFQRDGRLNSKWGTGSWQVMPCDSDLPLMLITFNSVEHALRFIHAASLQRLDTAAASLPFSTPSFDMVCRRRLASEPSIVETGLPQGALTRTVCPTRGWPQQRGQNATAPIQPGGTSDLFAPSNGPSI